MLLCLSAVTAGLMLRVPPAFCENGIVERVLNLEKSIYYAHKNRSEILIMERGVGLAKEKLSEARSFRYPKIDLMFNYSKIDDGRSSSNLSPFVLSPNFGSLMIPQSVDQYYFTRLSLWQVLYSGGKYTSSLKLASSNFSKAKNLLNIAKNNAAYEVKGAFYELLFMEAEISAYEEILPEMEKYETAPDRINYRGRNEGKLRINSVINKTRDRYTELKEKDYPGEKLDFLDTIGVELDVVFGIEGEFAPVTDDYEVRELLAWAFQHRSEPRQIQVEEEMDSLSMKLSMSARFPELALGMHYDFGSEESLGFGERVGIISLNLNFPLFDGWASWSRVSQRKAQLHQNKLKRGDIEDSIRLEVRKAHNDYRFWVKELSKRWDKLEALKRVSHNMKAGSPEVSVEFYKAYLHAKIRYLESVCRNLVSFAALEHAVGKSLKPE